MKITREEDYAITLIGALGKNYRQGYLSLRKLSREFHLPPAFLKKIAHKLKAAKLVKVKEGREGGYKLTSKPADVTLAQILKAFNPQPTLTSCIKGQMTKCPIYQSCESRGAWNKVANLLYGNLEKITLDKFIKISS